MKVCAGKRVLMLLENNPYPQDGRVRREATALVEAGYHVTVIAPAGPGQTHHGVHDGVWVYRYAAPPAANSLLGYLWEYGYAMVATFIIALQVFFREGFDIIHTHNPPDTFVFIAAFFKLLGKSFIYDHHDLAPEMYYARFGGHGNRLIFHSLVLLEKLSCRLADHVIATNESYKTVEMQRGSVPEARITVVRNGPDLDRMRLVDSDPDLRSRAPTIIGFAGEMGYHDGVDYLLRALQRLVRDLGRTDFFCVIIGTGDARADLQDLAIQLGLCDFLWFTGYVPETDLLRYLSTTDICVDPDPSNPFTDRCTMIKMMEYMALGKPIVAFDLPEHRVTAGDAALYARPNDELDLARQIAFLMDAPARRRAMGKTGQDRIRAQLSWTHQVVHLLDAYEALDKDVSGKAPAPPGKDPCEDISPKPV